MHQPEQNQDHADDCDDPSNNIDEDGKTIITGQSIVIPVCTPHPQRKPEHSQDCLHRQGPQEAEEESVIPLRDTIPNERAVMVHPIHATVAAAVVVRAHREQSMRMRRGEGSVEKQIQPLFKEKSPTMRCSGRLVAVSRCDKCSTIVQLGYLRNARSEDPRERISTLFMVRFAGRTSERRDPIQRTNQWTQSRANRINHPTHRSRHSADSQDRQIEMQETE